MTNLFGIEMSLLVLGIFILTKTAIQLIGTALQILTAIHKNESWGWNTTFETIAVTIGIVLIIISQSL